MKNNLTKILVLLFLVILAGLLITHQVILRNVRAEFAAKETALNTQISDLAQQVKTMTEKNRRLTGELKLAGIKDNVIKDNYGTARESAEAFRLMLLDGGCTKMDQLNPLFEELGTILMKKNDAGALANLDLIHSIIFGSQATTP